jgi:hypothetical protein
VPGAIPPLRAGADASIHPHESRVLELCLVRHANSYYLRTYIVCQPSIRPGEALCLLSPSAPAEFGQAASRPLVRHGFRS